MWMAASWMIAPYMAALWIAAFLDGCFLLLVILLTLRKSKIDSLGKSKIDLTAKLP